MVRGFFTLFFFFSGDTKLGTLVWTSSMSFRFFGAVIAFWELIMLLLLVLLHSKLLIKSNGCRRSHSMSSETLGIESLITWLDARAEEEPVAFTGVQLRRLFSALCSKRSLLGSSWYEY